jgi:Cof subfamily protein (haloacid dehalogenase superfamily)
MIITDLDNTLLRSEKYISDYTISVLKKCQQRGIMIVFATARSTHASMLFLHQFKPDIFVGYGGALVLAGKEIIYKYDIPADISFNLIQDCLKEPEVSTIYATCEDVAHTNEIFKFNSEQEAQLLAHYQYSDFSVNENRSYMKISLVAENPEVVDKIAAKYPMCDLLRYTGEDLYRFANRNAVKWKAVKALLDYYQVGADEYIAFGDDINDLEMIENCRHGVAVSNAIDEVKAVANYICDSNDNDGVAKWLDERLFKCV